MESASRLGGRYNRRPDKDQAAAIGTTLGTFYLAAAVNYVLALEAFVNLLIELLRKGEFQDEVFDRATTKADFELRALSLSLYCSGFASAPFPPDSLSFKQVRRLRAFRNNLLHGNVTRDNHVMYLVPEDHFIFHWWPATDEIDKQLSFDAIPLARVLFRKTHAQTVRNLVEEIVDTVQNALEPSHRSWVKGWRRGLLVPATLQEGRWVPNLAPSRVYTPKKQR
ncbi:MAG: hypothetical protein HYS35_05395 [Betaproteobacteria bacterium]|nr:hypothetical protein [Betaproteobacteria bacterium]